jgi:Sigma-70 region 2
LRGSGVRVGIVRERHPTPPALAAVFSAGSCPVPDYVPPLVRLVLPWARRHVAQVVARYGISREDCWDEVLAALLRAAVHFRPESGAFPPYAHTAVHRACWRYVVRDHVRQQRHGTRVALEDVALSAELTAPSAEAEAIARDAARRAWILREHAALAAARGDPDTATRLHAAASAADRVARRTRRRSSRSA